MAYTEKQVETIFDSILEQIENGRPLRQILKDEGMPSSKTFFEWIGKDDVKVKRYAHACEVRADVIFEEIIDIADDKTHDEIHTENGVIQNTEFIQRSRVRIDARKWVVSKLNPKKYGDRLQHANDPDNPMPKPQTIYITTPEGKTLDDFSID
jgi:hypothetical protein